MATNIKLREFVKELHTLVTASQASEKNKDDVASVLGDTAHLLDLPDVTCSSSRFPQSHLGEYRKEFIKSHHANVLDILISGFTVDWVSSLTADSKKTLDAIFLQGPNETALLSLCTNISESGPGYRVHRCVSLVERLVLQHGIRAVLVEHCTQAGGKQHVAERRERWNALSTVIVSLPERIVNKLRGETSAMFYPQAYVPFVADELLFTMRHVHAQMKAGRDCSLGMMSTLLGRLCLTGHGNVAWPLLLREWVPLTQGDALWRRLANQLVLGLPDRCMEATVTPFLRHAPWYGTVQAFLGHGVLENSKLDYLLSTKLTLMRHSEEDIILQNIIGYLASLDILKPKLVALVRRLLEVWSDGSSIKHASYEQHLYVSKAIIICVAFVRQKESLAAEMQDELLSLLMPGVQHHLASSVERVRRLGMIVAEHVTSCANVSPDNVLKFEYEKDGEVEQLVALSSIPADPGVQCVQDTIDNLKLGPSEISLKDAGNADKTPPDCDSELDSDDDFQPYNMSHDTETRPAKAPLYVRECMEGVISNDEPDKVEVALECAEKLIRTHKANSREIAVEFTKVLVHLDDKYCLPDFHNRRHGSLVALCVVSPIPVAQYLIEQFYERNYNIRQRLDMLEVLASAAQEISGLQQQGPGDAAAPLPKVTVVNNPDDEEDEEGGEVNWRAVVQKRIDSKTRIISRGRTRPEPTASSNRFADVAGHFFFPLLSKFDKAVDNTFDLMGEDHLLLNRLIYTLGILLYSASNCLIVRQMAKALCEFVWVFRFHPQQGVRQSLMFALSMFALATPGHILLSDLQQDVYDIKQWLEHVVQKDESTDCQKMAVQALILLEQNIKLELEQSKPIK